MKDKENIRDALLGIRENEKIKGEKREECFESKELGLDVLTELADVIAGWIIATDEKVSVHVSDDSTAETTGTAKLSCALPDHLSVMRVNWVPGIILRFFTCPEFANLWNSEWVSYR